MYLYVSEELPANAIRVSPLSDYSNTSRGQLFSVLSVYEMTVVEQMSDIISDVVLKI